MKLTQDDSTDMLRYAERIYVVYQAFIQAGFEDDQAFTLTRTFMAMTQAGKTASSGNGYL